MNAHPRYGQPPLDCGVFELDFTEYMHWMYLPIMIDEVGSDPYSEPLDVRLPPSLEFTTPLVEAAFSHELELGNRWRYAYLTARRGWATPGNPLNRPGFHADGHGTPDVNYVWTDRWPTDYVVGDVEAVTGTITSDHIASLDQFEHAARAARFGSGGLEIVHYPDSALLRLDAGVIHAAPEIPAPGGERSFLKVSFSNDRYDLLGNSHNHLFDYAWPMHSRQAVRNDPATAAGDSSHRKA